MQPNYTQMPPQPYPGGQHLPQQQYAPPQYHEQAAPGVPPAPAPAPATMPNFIDPSGAGGGGGGMSPIPRNLIGYAVAAIPTAYDPNNPGPNGMGVRAQVTVDYVVVGIDAQGNPLPPVEFGESLGSPPRPACLRLDTFPAEFRGAWWNNEQIVKELAPHVGTGNVILGRFRQGDQGNRPPLLERLAENDAARQALAMAWQQRTQSPGSLKREVGNGLTEINGGPPKKEATANGGMPPQPGAAYAQPYGQPGGYVQPMPPNPMAGQGQWGGPPAPPMPPAPGAQVAYPPPPQMPPQPAGPAPVPPAALAQGWTPEAWATAPPHIRAAYGA